MPGRCASAAISTLRSWSRRWRSCSSAGGRAGRPILFVHDNDELLDPGSAHREVVGEHERVGKAGLIEIAGDVRVHGDAVPITPGVDDAHGDAIAHNFFRS